MKLIEQIKNTIFTDMKSGKHFSKGREEINGFRNKKVQLYEMKSSLYIVVYKIITYFKLIW